MTDLLRRAWERLREAYEGQLVHDAIYEDREVTGRRPIALIGVARSRGEGGARGAVVATGLRPPRPLPVFGALLRPKVLQFGLPAAALSTVIKLTRTGILAPDISLSEAAFEGAIMFTIGAAIYTMIGGALFKRRWARLRDEAYRQWRWREVAEAEMLEVGTRPRSLLEPGPASPP